MEDEKETTNLSAKQGRWNFKNRRRIMSYGKKRGRAEAGAHRVYYSSHHRGGWTSDRTREKKQGMRIVTLQIWVESLVWEVEELKLKAIEGEESAPRLSHRVELPNGTWLRRNAEQKGRKKRTRATRVKEDTGWASWEMPPENSQQLTAIILSLWEL